MKHLRHVRNQKGQAALLVGLMFLFFISLFTFVVFTGLLVNAKINLQNAADLAAYAGAATQARQLNSVSFLNYEMRRQYKKFLFRYYVMGNRAQKTHPGTGPRRLWSPDGSKNYEVPAVCIVFKPENNFCQVAVNPAIVIPQTSPFDLIGQASIEQLKQIEKIRQEGCEEAKDINRRLLALWLFNTDPELEGLRESLLALTNNPDAQVAARVLRTIIALGQGLGFYPRNIILKQRIETLESYLNQTPERAVTLQRVQEMETSQEPPAFERSILAYKSAFNTLGEHTFSDIENIVMTELLPSTGEGGLVARFQPITAEFDSYFVDLELKPHPSGDPALKDCTPVPRFITVKNAPLGVYKLPDPLTYYAIRLTADARIPLNPFGQKLKLKAYAAARPFGSRIGPQFDDPEQAFKAFSITRRPSNSFVAVAECLTRRHGDCQLPNLPILADEPADAQFIGWENPQWIGATANLMISQGGLITDVTPALEAAMAPNPWEKGRYNIPFDEREPQAQAEDPLNQTGGDPFISYFGGGNAGLEMALWAPIFRADALAGTDLSTIIDDALSGAGITGPERVPLTAAMTTYINQLETGSKFGDGNEEFKVVRIKDPMRQVDPTSGGGTVRTIPLAEEFMLKNEEDYKTSWANVVRSDYNRKGRIGYSVKFVPLKSLSDLSSGREPSSQSSDSNWTNSLFLDAEGEADLTRMTH